ncbi:transthyretin domain protein [Diplocarpon rosae]|nr:transthyretin domain protein [Diplocarpon rosae]
MAAWEIQLAADEREGEYARENWGPAAAMKKIIEERGLVEESQSRPLGTSLWKLQFNTGAHYGVANTFFPVVELSFLVKHGEHFHVPLLLGPYSFTTYRGS